MGPGVVGAAVAKEDVSALANGVDAAAGLDGAQATMDNTQQAKCKCHNGRIAYSMSTRPGTKQCKRRT